MSQNQDQDKPRCEENPLEARSEFRQALVQWFLEEGKDYPWRRTRNPYEILVSEIMLQQTRIETVLGRGYYTNWLERFPDEASLAAADEDSILKAWEGLGYYRRARNLQKAAQVIVQDYNGKFPRDWKEIRSLPGVGDYTAGAVAAFAFNQPVAMVDGNVARVLARLMDYGSPVDATEGKRILERWSGDLVHPERAREFQSAIMELGQRICTSRNPACRHCPVSRFCATRGPEGLPVKRAKVQIVEKDEFVLWLHDEGRTYLEKEAGSRRKGLWRLPLETERRDGEVLLQLRYAITRYQVTMRVLRGTEGDRRGRTQGQWFDEAGLAEVAMAAPYRRALNQLMQRNREGDLFGI